METYNKNMIFAGEFDGLVRVDKDAFEWRKFRYGIVAIVNSEQVQENCAMLKSVKTSFNDHIIGYCKRLRLEFVNDTISESNIVIILTDRGITNGNRTIAFACCSIKDKEPPHGITSIYIDVVCAGEGTGKHVIGLVQRLGVKLNAARVRLSSTRQAFIPYLKMGFQLSLSGTGNELSQTMQSEEEIDSAVQIFKTSEKEVDTKSREYIMFLITLLKAGFATQSPKCKDVASKVDQENSAVVDYTRNAIIDYEYSDENFVDPTVISADDISRFFAATPLNDEDLRRRIEKLFDNIALCVSSGLGMVLGLEKPFLGSTMELGEQLRELPKEFLDDLFVVRQREPRKRKPPRQHDE